jgi:hypothetical protein
MSDRAEIEELARLVGIEVHYADIFGHSHEASDETILSLIEAFGLAPDPRHARRELRDREENAPLGLDPMHAEARHPELPVRFPAGCREIVWRCQLETGEETGGRL